jgi:hypothetical protein
VQYANTARLQGLRSDFEWLVAERGTHSENVSGVGNAQNHGSPFARAHRDFYLSGADNEDGVALIAFAKEDGATWVFHSDRLRFQEGASIVTEAAECMLSGVLAILALGHWILLSWSCPGISTLGTKAIELCFQSLKCVTAVLFWWAGLG